MCHLIVIDYTSTQLIDCGYGLSYFKNDYYIAKYLFNIAGKLFKNCKQIWNREIRKIIIYIRILVGIFGQQKKYIEKI